MNTYRQTTHWTRLLLTVGLIAALATTVVPVLSADREDILRDDALEDCSRIAAALRQFSADTGLMPSDLEAGIGDLHLVGPGLVPGGIADDAVRDDLLDMCLTRTDLADTSSTWNGPYMMSLREDPWDRAYVVTPSTEGDSPWILSAGPNGVIETDRLSRTIRGDDVGVRLTAE